MNKQFLSLLLLTSFVGTVSASGLLSFAPRTVHSIFSNGYTRTFMSAMGSKVAGLSHTSQYALGSIPLMGAGVATGAVLSNGVSVSEGTAKFLADWGGALGKTATVSIREAVTASTEAAVVAAEAARLNARPFYTKTGQAISGYGSNGLKAVTGYASAARISASNGVQAVVASAKLHPKTAIAAGVVGTAAVGYLVYKAYNWSTSHSISLNEQGKANLRTYLAEAHALPCGLNVWSLVQPEQLQLVEYFTSEKTGLPKAAVKALNEFVTFDGSCKMINYLFEHQNGRTQPGTVAKYTATKQLRDAALDKLEVALAA